MFQGGTVGSGGPTTPAAATSTSAAGGLAMADGTVESSAALDLGGGGATSPRETLPPPGSTASAAVAVEAADATAAASLKGRTAAKASIGKKEAAMGAAAEAKAASPPSGAAPTKAPPCFGRESAKARGRAGGGGYAPPRAVVGPSSCADGLLPPVDASPDDSSTVRAIRAARVSRPGAVAVPGRGGPSVRRCPPASSVAIAADNGSEDVSDNLGLPRARRVQDEDRGSDVVSLPGLRMGGAGLSVAGENQPSFQSLRDFDGSVASGSVGTGISCSGGFRRLAMGVAPVPITVRTILSRVRKSADLMPMGEEVRMVAEALGLGWQAGMADSGMGASNYASSVTGEGSTHFSTSRSGRVQPSSSGSSSRSSLRFRHDGRPAVFHPWQAFVVLRGPPGVGKTMLAAMVVSCREILSRFWGGVGWIRLGQTPLDPLDLLPDSDPCACFDRYVEHCQSLCRQLNTAPPDFEGPNFEDAQDTRQDRIRKTRDAMEGVLQDMSNLLGRDLPILIIIDDVCHRRDVDWFSFANRPTSPFTALITTRLRIDGRVLPRARTEGESGNFQPDHSTEEESTTNQDHNGSVASTSFPPQDQGSFFRCVIEANSLGEDETISLLQSWAQRRHLFSRAAKELEALQVLARACGGIPAAIWTDGVEMMSHCCSPFGGASPSPSGAFPSSPLPQSIPMGDELYKRIDCSFAPELHGGLDGAEEARCAFAVFCAVFSGEDGCSWGPPQLVPDSAVRAVWVEALRGRWQGSLFGKESDARGSAPLRLLKRMVSLGLMEEASGGLSSLPTREGRGGRRTVRRFRVSHSLLVRFGLCVWESSAAPTLACGGRGGGGIDLGASILGRARVSLKRRLRSLAKSSLHERSLAGKSEPLSLSLRCLFDLALVQSFLNQGSKNSDVILDAAVCHDVFVYEDLPYHMFRTNKDSMQKRALKLLSNSDFLSVRMATLGIKRGTEVHLRDFSTANRCSYICTRKKARPSINESLPILHLLSDFLRQQLLVNQTSAGQAKGQPSTFDISEALKSTTHALQEHSH